MNGIGIFRFFEIQVQATINFLIKIASNQAE